MNRTCRNMNRPYGTMARAVPAPPGGLSPAGAAVLLGTLVLLGWASPAGAAPPHAEPSQRAPRLGEQLDSATAAVPGELLVGFGEGVPVWSRAELARALGARVEAVLRTAGIEHWSLPPAIDREWVLAQLRDSGLVRFAEPNFRRWPRETLPDDPALYRQWFLHNTGQTYDLVQSDGGGGTEVVDLAGTPGADMDLPAAWDMVTGSGEVVVAVVDDSLDVAHPALKDLIWLNPGELTGTAAPQIDNGMGAHCAAWPGGQDANGDGVFNVRDYGCDPRIDWDADADSHGGSGGNGFLDPLDLVYSTATADGVDDDGNGLVDDIAGWRFGETGLDRRDTSAAPYSSDPDFSFLQGNSDGHGTAVAGSVGAASDDSEGGAGVNWRVRILPVAFDFGVASGTDALAYAAELGAHIVNASWGGAAFSFGEAAGVDAVGAAGGLFVAAAGNGNYDNDVIADFPSGLTGAHVVAVAASDDDDALVSWTHHGSHSVDLAAPGRLVYTTMPLANTYGAYGYSTESEAGDDDPLWGYISGTSFSSPLVAGVAALAKAHHPGAGAAELKGRILAGADPVTGSPGATATDARADAAGALTAATGPVLVLAELATGDGAEGAPDPGESLDLVLTLENVWAATGPVTGTVSTDDPFATVVDPGTAWPAMDAGARRAATVPAVLELDAGLEGYRRVWLTVDLYTGAGFHARRRVALHVGHLPFTGAPATTISTFDQGDVQRWHLHVPAGGRTFQVRNVVLNGGAACDGDSPDMDLYAWTGADRLDRGVVNLWHNQPDPSANEELLITDPPEGVLWVAAFNYSADGCPGLRYDLRVNQAPGAPTAAAPADGAGFAGGARPNLRVTNAADPEGDALSYEFTVYHDAGLTSEALSSGDVAAGDGETAWQLTAELAGGTYYWEAVASHTKAGQTLAGEPSAARSFVIAADDGGDGGDGGSDGDGDDGSGDGEDDGDDSADGDGSGTVGDDGTDSEDSGGDAGSGSGSDAGSGNDATGGTATSSRGGGGCRAVPPGTAGADGHGPESLLGPLVLGGLFALRRRRAAPGPSEFPLKPAD